MMLTDTLSLLTRTPAALDALLRGLPDGWTLTNEGAATWSPFDIVAHLIHAERTDWMPRVTMIMTVGESRAFEPFDREGDVRDRRRSASLDQLLDQFARVRADNLTALRGLDLAPADLDRRGTHPALGAVTLSQLLATWAAHDLEGDGAPVSGRGRSLERLSRRPPVRRAQRVMIGTRHAVP